jgi:hypothetical protein
LYIAGMIGRPCKPDPDMNWLWRTLLPNTPLPSCGAEIHGAASADEEPNCAAHARKQAAPSWLRKLWPVRSQSKLTIRRKASA